MSEASKWTNCGGQDSSVRVSTVKGYVVAKRFNHVLCNAEPVPLGRGITERVCVCVRPVRNYHKGAS